MARRFGKLLVLRASRLPPIRLSPPRLLDLLLISVAIGTAIILPFLSGWPGGLFRENGPLEDSQVALLLLSTILFLRAAARLESWAALTTIGLACFSAFCTVRELPRCTSPYYRFGACVPGEWKDGIYIASAGLILLAFIVVPRLRPAGFGRKALAALPGFLLHLWPLLVLCAILAAAQFAEIVEIDALEEGLELVAYLLLALLGLASAQAGDRKAGRFASKNAQWRAGT